MTQSASLPADSDPLFSAPVREGEIVAGKYVVGRLLGLGGMGAVFEAHDSGLERRVALKVLLQRLVTSPTAAQRFVREARAATRITSEHVVKLLEIETLPDGTPLLVMEYLEGKDLRALLREHGPVEPRQAVDYLLQALQAVAEGHMQAIVHRDLKPSNLFLTERADGTPLIKVLDFGIAKTIESGRPEDLALTGSEDVQLGSPTYMPPEQFRNPRDVDARADIWALGVTLYELISGRVPFQGLSYPELVSQVLSARPDTLKSALAGVSLPKGLAEIVAKCLEKDRDLRYRNAVELAVALAPFGSDDARLSLTRVSGLLRLRTSTSIGAPRDTSGAYEVTLPVPADYLADGPHSQTSSGTRFGSRRVPRSGLWLGLGLLTAAAIFGSIIWRQRWLVDRPTSALPSAPPALAASLSSLRALPVAPPAPKMPEQPPSQARPSTPPLLPKRAPVPALGAHLSKPSRPPAPATTQGEPSGTAPPVAAPAPTGSSEASDKLIESLIMRRH